MEKIFDKLEIKTIEFLCKNEMLSLNYKLRYKKRKKIYQIFLDL